jgi:hypothetical protein
MVPNLLYQPLKFKVFRAAICTILPTKLTYYGTLLILRLQRVNRSNGRWTDHGIF